MQYASVVESNNGLEVTFIYSENAKGALLTFVLISNETIPSNTTVIGLDNLTHQIVDFKEPTGLYKVFFYDIGENGTLFTGTKYPAVMEEFYHKEDQQGQGKAYREGSNKSVFFLCK